MLETNQLSISDTDLLLNIDGISGIILQSPPSVFVENFDKYGYITPDGDWVLPRDPAHGILITNGFLG
ncbi:MAG: hypothetical protein ACE5RC_04255, partial [Nitrosopumilus sp.]